MALLIGLIGNHDINHLLSQGILILVPNASWVRAVQGLIIHSLLHTHGLSHHDSVHTLLLNPCVLGSGGRHLVLSPCDPTQIQLQSAVQLPWGNYSTDSRSINISRYPKQIFKFYPSFVTSNYYIRFIQIVQTSL